MYGLYLSQLSIMLINELTHDHDDVITCPDCSSAVAVSVANNLAEYLHNALNQSNDYAG